jgi:hypothetical protein
MHHVEQRRAAWSSSGLGRRSTVNETCAGTALKLCPPASSPPSVINTRLVTFLYDRQFESAVEQALERDSLFIRVRTIGPTRALISDRLRGWALPFPRTGGVPCAAWEEPGRHEEAISRPSIWRLRNHQIADRRTAPSRNHGGSLAAGRPANSPTR